MRAAKIAREMARLRAVAWFRKATLPASGKLG